MRDSFVDVLKMNDVKYLENVQLSNLSSIGIGANAEIIVLPKSIDQLIKAIKELESAEIPHKILGRMTNVLPPDDKYRNVIIKTDLLRGIEFNGNLVEAYAGEMVPSLSFASANYSLSGFEELSGIPGSLGGAIFGNAGAFGREISDLVVSVTIYDCLSQRMITLTKDECDFSYRNSIFKQKPWIVLRATLNLISSNSVKIKEKMQLFRKIRVESQPVGLPSLGSTFKRPAKDLYAAKLIDDCGLKGYRIGGAEVSEKHAGFIVNRGCATAKDYLDLMDHIKKVVYSKYSIMLENEIEIL